MLKKFGREKFKNMTSVLFVFLISNFHLVLNVVFFLLGNSPAFEFYMSMFRNTLFYLHRRVLRLTRQSVPKRRHIKFRRR